MKALLAALALLSLHAQAQTTLPATPAAGAGGAATVVPIALQVERLAPQLVAFAGSRGNFENLVNGLALGVPVTLTTVGADGLAQTVTFTNAGGAVSEPVEIARVLEGARQQLIADGVATPSAQQIGEVVSGTTVPVSVSAIPAPPAAAGAAAGASPAQQIQSRNTPIAPRVNTSDSRVPGNTSATPTPTAPGAGSTVPAQPVAPAVTPASPSLPPPRR